MILKVHKIAKSIRMFFWPTIRGEGTSTEIIEIMVCDIKKRHGIGNVLPLNDTWQLSSMVGGKTCFIDYVIRSRPEQHRRYYLRLTKHRKSYLRLKDEY